MINIIRAVDSAIEPLRKVSNCVASPLLDLTIRLYMGNIFFKSGWLKFSNFLDGHWDNTIYLFENAHPVPFLQPDVAAVLGTAGETMLPILLAFGLFGRFAAAGLILMTAVIQFGIPMEYELQNPLHYFWMLLLAVILIKGPGRLSLDYVVAKFLLKKDV